MKTHLSVFSIDSFRTDFLATLWRKFIIILQIKRDLRVKNSSMNTKNDTKEYPQDFALGLYQFHI